jgi:hypothetical protein
MPKTKAKAISSKIVRILAVLIAFSWVNPERPESTVFSIGMPY